MGRKYSGVSWIGSDFADSDVARDSRRHGLAQELEPLEKEKLRLDALGLAIDQVLLTLQGRP
jgi:hypothetical protein